jgi:hypothetical protein
MAEREPIVEMPAPPFPAPDNDILSMIVADTLQTFNAGEVDVHGAILMAAVNAWSEGHIEGEDHCAGCEHRGADPKAAQAMRSEIAARPPLGD